MAVFTDGSALENPGLTSSGAVIYYQGLEQEPVCLSKPVCSNGNNYIGELVGIQSALHHISEQEELWKDIHFFIDCQPAIVSAFGSDTPRNKEDIILQIRQMTASLEDKGHILSIHWIPGHRDFKGNELADNLAKSAATEMVGKKKDFYEGAADRSELIKIMKGRIQEKWQKIYDTSTKTDLLQEVISEVGKQPITSDREVESTINQIIAGQVALNYLKAKIDNTKSDKCDFCDKKEAIQHYIFECEKYNSHREVLEREVERILIRNDIKITVINLKVLTGNLDDTDRLIDNELRSAFGNFLRSTGRLLKSHWFI